MRPFLQFPIIAQHSLQYYMEQKASTRAVLLHM